MWPGDRHFLALVFDDDPRPFHGVMPYVDGAPADQHRFGPYPPLLEAAKKRQPN